MTTKINELVSLLNTVPSGQLTENTLQTYLNILNIEMLDKENIESPVEKAARLLNEANDNVENNSYDYGHRIDIVRQSLSRGSFEFSKGNYKYTYDEIKCNKDLARNFEKYSELMAALSKLV